MPSTPPPNGSTPADVPWQATIVVPFAPETAASGIGAHGVPVRVLVSPHGRRCRRVDDGERIVLRFGAVDYEATVWVNGSACAATRAATRRSRPTSRRVVPARTIDIVVRAFDDPHDLAKPRGKQDWQLEPHSIWYPRTTGIWQTVWLEVRAAGVHRQPRWTPNLERWEIGLEAWLGGAPPRRPAAARETRASAINCIADDTYSR